MALPGFDNEGLKPALIEKLADLVLILKLSGIPLPSGRLERLLGLKPRRGIQIRAMVSYLRCCHAPIGSSGKGYSWAHNHDDLKETKEHLEARIVRMRRVLVGLHAPDWDFDLGSDTTHTKQRVLTI